MMAQTVLTGGVQSQNKDPVLFKLVTDQFTLKTSLLNGGYKWDKTANFTQTEIMGRSSPIITYANSSVITLTVTLNFAAFEDAVADVADVLKSLTSLTFPVEPGIKPPPLCKVTAGKDFKNWECVLSTVSCDSGAENTWSEEGASMFGTASLTFIGVEIQNVSLDDWIATRNYTKLSF